MAPPHGEAVLTSFPRPLAKPPAKPTRLSNDNLKRTISDIAFQLSKEMDKEIADLAPISEAEAEDAKCECCGMSEEYTPEYVKRVREQFSGKWICGLCSEAVKEEKQKNGGNIDEALNTHMSHCGRFNKLGRAYPVLCQAQAMREIFKKGSRVSSRDVKSLKKGGIARSTSCIPAITREMTHLSIGN